MTAQGILHLGMHGEYNVYLQGNYLFLTSIIKENKLLICVQGTGKSIWHISLTLYMYNVPCCEYMEKCNGNYCLEEPSGPLYALIRFISYYEVRSVECGRIWGCFFLTFWGKALCLEVNSQILLMVLLSEWHVLTVFEDSTKQEDSVSSAHPKQAHVSDLHMHSTRELDLFLQSHDSKLIRHPAQILRSSLLRRETYCFNISVILLLRQNLSIPYMI